MVQSQPGQTFCETLSQKKPSPKKGLVEWLSTTKKKKKGGGEGGARPNQAV
jgi:hypothetical protein